MKKCIFCLFILLAVVACSQEMLSVAGTSFIEYQVGQNEYAVVVVQEDYTQDKDLREIALKRAAKIAQSHGVRYFMVTSEGDAQAVRAPQKTRAPQNLYYNLLQGQKFNRDDMQANPPPSQIVPGYRVVFKLYNKKPKRNVWDVCSLIDCQD